MLGADAVVVDFGTEEDLLVVNFVRLVLRILNGKRYIHWRRYLLSLG